MTRTTNIKKIIGLGALGFLFAFIVFYTIFQTKSLAKGVDMDIVGITDGEVFEDDIITLTGFAIHANFITMNGKEVVVDGDEKFTEELILSPGINIVTFEAKDKFNQKTSYEYRVFYKDQSLQATALNN